jgi:hypothetical protein
MLRLLAPLQGAMILGMPYPVVPPYGIPPPATLWPSLPGLRKPRRCYEKIAGS